MGVREVVNKNKPVMVAVVLIAIGAALWVSYSQATGGTRNPSEAYYTIDEGKTWFAGPLTEAPPFQKDGKEAVRVVLYECNGEQFVGYIEKLDARSKEVLDKLIKVRESGQPAGNLLTQAQNAMSNGWVRKLPGESEWGHRGSMFEPEIKCPDSDKRAVRAIP